MEPKKIDNNKAVILLFISTSPFCLIFYNNAKRAIYFQYVYKICIFTSVSYTHLFNVY